MFDGCRQGRSCAAHGPAVCVGKCFKIGLPAETRMHEQGDAEGKWGIAVSRSSVRTRIASSVTVWRSAAPLGGMTRASKSTRPAVEPESRSGRGLGCCPRHATPPPGPPPGTPRRSDCPVAGPRPSNRARPDLGRSQWLPRSIKMAASGANLARLDLTGRDGGLRLTWPAASHRLPQPLPLQPPPHLLQCRGNQRRFKNLVRRLQLFRTSCNTVLPAFVLLSFSASHHSLSELLLLSPAPSTVVATSASPLQGWRTGVNKTPGLFRLPRA